MSRRPTKIGPAVRCASVSKQKLQCGLDAGHSGDHCALIPSDAKWPKVECVCGGPGGGDIRLVRMRVDGKATQYHSKPVALCAMCRRAERGRWMYADRAG